MVLKFFRGGGADGLEHAQSKLLEMLADDRHSFDVATSALLTGADPTVVGPDLSRTDQRVNEAEREIRRGLVVHASVHGVSQVAAILTYMSVVKDVERNRRLRQEHLRRGGSGCGSCPARRIARN